jgi:predicted O-methyltransferase YrrM
MSIETHVYLEASSALDRLAGALDRNGQSGQADNYLKIAAEIELLSQELQRCWGGPFNGQEGRRQLIKNLITALSPTAIIETGSYRGITTKWLGENFDGEVLSCELKKIYFYQARANTATLSNVKIELLDSTEFLLRLPASVVGGTPLFYLDSHWEEYLPLRKEIEIIIQRFPDATIVIDDFCVPNDPGYGWDNYGPGNALELDHLQPFQTSGYTFYFPTFLSSQETGAVRGCCVMTKNAIEILDGLPNLKGGTWKFWIERTRAALDVFQDDRVMVRNSASTYQKEGLSYPDQISFLNRVCNERLDVITDLKRICDERLAAIERLTTECEVRLKIIDELRKKME